MPDKKNSISRIITFPEPYGHSERWLALGDISNSTFYFAQIAEYTLNKLNDGNQLYFKLTTEWDKAIESIFKAAETCCPRPSSLGNTMGDGFLVIGPSGHGNTQIKPHLLKVLKMCRKLKLYGDKILADVRSFSINDILRTTRNEPELPKLNLKLSIHYGHVVESIGKKRYISDCINYLTRMTSAMYRSEKDNIIGASDEWFCLLPEKIKKAAHEKGFKRNNFLITGYPNKEGSVNKNLWIIEVPKDEVTQKTGEFPEIKEENARQDSFWNLVL